MIFFCKLTDWETSEVTKGKAKGNISTTRTALALDNWNWAIGTQRGGTDDGDVKGESYYGGLRLVLPALLSYVDVQVGESVDLIVETLSKLTGKKAPEVPDMETREDYMKFGKLLDDTFDVSFGKVYPPTVTKRLFPKAAEVDDVELVEA